MPSMPKYLRFNASQSEASHPDGNLVLENIRLRSLLAKTENVRDQLIFDARKWTNDREAVTCTERLLKEEMHHRLKNTLTIAKAIVSQTLRAASSLQDGRLAVEKRLSALAAAQTDTLGTQQADMSLSDIIRSAIAPFDEENGARIIVGPCNFDIDAVAVLPISLTLNELCTNALKYGALSTNNGHVEIDLEADAQCRSFTLTWTERGGPAVELPMRPSFGSQLIKLMAKQMKGETVVMYEPTGLIFTLVIPLATLHPHAAQPTSLPS